MGCEKNNVLRKEEEEIQREKPSIEDYGFFPSDSWQKENYSAKLQYFPQKLNLAIIIPCCLHHLPL